MKFWKWLVASAFVIGSLLCFGLTIAFTMVDKIAAATLMASLFVVLMLMHYLPQMEYFKAYGIEAKMRQKLNEADAILEQLKQAAIVSGKLAYYVVGWGSRAGHPLKTKQSVADDVDKLLRGAGVSEEELTKLKWQYMRFVLFDLDNAFGRMVLKELDKARNSAKPDQCAVIDKELIRSRPTLEDTDNFEDKIAAQLPPKDALDETTEAELARIRARLLRIADECTIAGRLTDEAADLIEQSY